MHIVGAAGRSSRGVWMWVTGEGAAHTAGAPGGARQGNQYRCSVDPGGPEEGGPSSTSAMPSPSSACSRGVTVRTNAAGWIQEQSSVHGGSRVSNEQKPDNLQQWNAAKQQQVCRDCGWRS